MYVLKRSAAIILFSFVGIVVLSMGAAGASGGEWAPRLKDLEAISMRNAILVNLITVSAIAALIYLFVS